MLVINYKGKTPQQPFYSIGVKGNNKANKICFIFNAIQQDIDLRELQPYLKVQNKEHSYLDKIKLEEVQKSYDDTILETIWEMTKKSTQYRNLELQLQFQSDNSDEIVWQTQIVEIELSETINADEEASEKNPTIINQLEKEVANHETRIKSLESEVSDTYTKEETDNLLNKKVDKVEGKGLSSNDFTDDLKTKLEGIDLDNYPTKEEVPSCQTTTTIIKNALTNINGRELSTFVAINTQLQGYDVIVIKNKDQDRTTLSVERAKDYMEYMTGSRFLPTYNYEKPKNSLFVMSDNSIWKPQYDNPDGNGLVLWLISRGATQEEEIKEVGIEKIYLRHTKPKNEIIKQNDIVELGGAYGQPYCNDPTKTFVCIRTTPINSKIEEEIALGRFVIRFNYPTHDRKRGFTHHLNSHSKKIEGVIFVNASMVKTNAYGEKYIYWEENYLRFVRRFYTIENDHNLGSYLNLEKLDVVNRDDIGLALYGIKGHSLSHFGYVPSDHDQVNAYFFSKGATKYGAKETFNGFPQDYRHPDFYPLLGKSVNDIKNNYWCPMIVDGEIVDNYYDPFIIKSFAWRFRRGDRKNKLTYTINGEDFSIFDNDWNYYPMTSNQKKNMLRFITRVSLRPSCAIIDSNYENLTDSQNCWLKTFSQSTQHINLSLNICARMVDMDYQNPLTLFISRIRIGK